MHVHIGEKGHTGEKGPAFHLIFNKKLVAEVSALLVTPTVLILKQKKKFR